MALFWKHLSQDIEEHFIEFFNIKINKKQQNNDFTLLSMVWEILTYPISYPLKRNAAQFLTLTEKEILLTSW